MKFLATFSVICFGPTMVQAHVGHLGELVGHDHWVAGAAIGVAAAISIWGAIKGKPKTEDDTTDEVEPEEESA